MNLTIINHQNSILDIHSSWITHDKSPIFPGFSPGPEIPAASTAASKRVNRVPRTCPPPVRLDAFPGRLVEGAHHAGLVPLVPLVVFWGDELPLGDGGVNGWEIWGFGTLLFAFFGGNWKILDRSYLKVDIFMDELFT